MSEKNICVITGTRAEYGLLKTTIEEIQKSDKLSLSLIVTGMHLLEKYGNTIDVIKNDGIPIVDIFEMYNEDDPEDLLIGRALSRALKGFTESFTKLKPDILIVLGDRYEPLAAVIAAAALSIPIAHIHGGDSVLLGQVDEQIRHAITKFANIHFPVTQRSAERIKLLGEEEWRIHMVGSPGIDMIKTYKLLDREELVSKFELDSNNKLVICLQHPYVFEADKAGEHMKTTLKVLEDLELHTIIIYPNNDPGSNLIIQEIETKNQIKIFKIFKNLERIEYLSLLNEADLLIGNSSSGIIESAIFHLPIVNIGDRNKGRECAENVIHTKHEYEEIKSAVNKALSEEFKEFCLTVKNPYGEGNTAGKIVDILEKLEIDKKLLIKKLTYDV